MFRLVVLVVIALTGGGLGCEDKCGCGTKGCKHLHEEATCNSWQAAQLKNSLCAGEFGAPKNCAATQQIDTTVSGYAQCELGLPPDIGTTVGVAVLSYFAWVPLLARAKYYRWE